MENGWSINVGGGFHHCWGNEGGGFCAYADITLTVHFILNHYPHIERVMIIDLDAHQVKKKITVIVKVTNIFKILFGAILCLNIFLFIFFHIVITPFHSIPNDISDLSIFSVVLNGNTFI